MQYTLRGVPSQVNDVLRQKARQQAKSLNQIAIEALAVGAGVTEEKVHYHDLDDLAGTWKDDPKFDEAIQVQDQIDMTLWK